MSKTYDVVKAREAQAKYCKETGTPHFGPTTGRCWNCNRNIYEKFYWSREHGLTKEKTESEVTFVSGITVEEASEGLVTGCPHCHRSYVD